MTEYLAVLCNCEYSDDSNIIGTMCTHCKGRGEIERNKKWQYEVKVVNQHLYIFNNKVLIEERVPIIKEIFEFLLTRPHFIANNPRFRETLILKIEEFQADPHAECLKETLDKMTIFLDTLESHEEYKT